MSREPETISRSEARTAVIQEVEAAVKAIPQNRRLVDGLTSRDAVLAAIAAVGDADARNDEHPVMALVDKAKRWRDRGVLTPAEYEMFCAVVFVQMPEDMTPEDRARMIERGQQLAAEHPEWSVPSRRSIP